MAESGMKTTSWLGGVLHSAEAVCVPSVERTIIERSIEWRAEILVRLDCENIWFRAECFMQEVHIGSDEQHAESAFVYFNIG